MGKGEVLFLLQTIWIVMLELLSFCCYHETKFQLPHAEVHYKHKQKQLLVINSGKKILYSVHISDLYIILNDFSGMDIFHKKYYMELGPYHTACLSHL